MLEYDEPLIIYRFASLKKLVIQFLFEFILCDILIFGGFDVIIIIILFLIPSNGKQISMA